MRDFAVPVGRLLLALIFIMSGYSKITGWPGVVGAVEAKGLPIPLLFGAGAVLAELGGGLLVAIGYKARFGAAVLILFTVVTTIIFHNFWAFEGRGPSGADGQFHEEPVHGRRPVSGAGLWRRADERRW